MRRIRVRTASRLWFRLDATARAVALACLRWRSGALAPFLPF
jgi:hypothetical protein